MKKLLLSILTISLFQYSNASHMLGGTIYWQCLDNGKYQFFLELYRDCQGIRLSSFETKEIKIIGTILPKDSLENSFNSIAVNPDSIRWINSNNGQVFPICDNSNGMLQYSCSNLDFGTIQQYFFKSEPITLKGIPPKDGWKFFYGAECCRPSTIDNIQTTGNSMLIQAAMFATKDLDTIDDCFYSSPRFISPPPRAICRGRNAYNLIGIQPEGDSISYSWSRPLDVNYGVLNGETDTLNYEFGYSQINPTPDATFHSQNKESRLNPIDGNVNLSVFNGFGRSRYNHVIKIDSWRDAKIIASTYYEYILEIFDCDTLINGKPNNKPEVLLNGNKQSNLSLNFQAGDKINFPIQVTDNEYADLGVTFQSVSLKPYGQLFSIDFTDTTACDFPPCAVLKNTAPIYDSAFFAPIVKRERQITSNFEWQTNCNHLGKNGKSKTYLFYYTAQDDHCSIPQSVSGVIKIILHENNRTLKASMNCITESNGTNEISWNLNSISDSNLIQWYVYGASLESGPYQVLDSLPANSPLSYSDVSTSNHFYFVRSKGYGCDSVVSISAPSDTIKSTYDGLKVENTIDCVLLTWNQERSSYASDEIRKYYVYRETQTSSGFELIDSVLNTNQYCDISNVCGATIRYYVTADLSTSICKFLIDIVSINVPQVNLNLAVEELNNTLVAKDAIGNYQWYDCNAKSILFGETTQVFVPKDTGSYALILSRYGCIDTSVCMPIFSVGLAQISLQESLTYYPNPTTGKLNINLDQNASSMQVQLRNIQGQLLKELQLVNSNSFQLELPQEAGIYFIQLINSKGERANLKVVKQ